MGQKRLQLLENHRYERTIVQAAVQTYGPQAVAASLQNLLNQAMGLGMERRENVQQTCN